MYMAVSIWIAPPMINFEHGMLVVSQLILSEKEE